MCSYLSYFSHLQENFGEEPKKVFLKLGDRTEVMLTKEAVETITWPEMMHVVIKEKIILGATVPVFLLGAEELIN